MLQSALVEYVAASNMTKVVSSCVRGSAIQDLPYPLGLKHDLLEHVKVSASRLTVTAKKPGRTIPIMDPSNSNIPDVKYNMLRSS